MNWMAGLTHAAKAVEVPQCANAQCQQTQWQRWKSRREGILIANSWFCSLPCARTELTERVERAPKLRTTTQSRPHRLPLGLLMVSRGHIDQQQLTVALDMKASEPYLRIGDCLSRLGVVDETDITRALAAQRCLPVLLAYDPAIETSVPLRLQRLSDAVCFRSRGVADLIYIGFASDVDLPLVSAIETVLCVKAEPCIVPESVIEDRHAQSGDANRNEIVIDTVCSNVEIVNSICSYARQFGAARVRVSSTRHYFWTHLKGHRGELHLLHRLVPEASSSAAAVR